MPRSKSDDDDDDRPKRKARRNYDEDDNDDDRPKRKARRNYDEDEDNDDRPKRKAARNYDDDDEDDRRPKRKAARSYDDDDDDDRPRRGKSKRAKQKPKRGMMMALVAGGGLFLLLLLGGGIFLAVYLLSPKGDKEINGEQWYKVEDADNVLVAYFPGGRPELEKFEFGPPAFLAKKAGKNPEDLSFGTKAWIRKDDGREYSVMLMKFPGAGGGPNEAEQAFANSPRIPPGPGVDVVRDDSIMLGGHQARKLVVRRGNKGQVSVMAGIGNRYVLMAMVSGDRDVDHNDPKVKAFFDNLTLKQ
jgi:hypothetical protein